LTVPKPDLTLEEAIKITKDAFTSAAERDIHTGDYVEIWIITKEGTLVEKFGLRKD
jgi:20S proteasome subunit beta 6